MPECGAKARSGKPCRNRAMENGRCRLHGGKTEGGGAPKGNKNALKHGIYSAALLPDEQDIWAAIRLGDLDDDIKIARVQLRRALIAQLKAEQEDDNLEVESETETETIGEDAKTSTSVKKTRRPYEDIITRLLGRIGDLEQKRAELLRKPIDGGGEEPPASITVTIVDASKPNS